ncbi:hypothetical protein S7711_09975 [Stachybotrys chartarum IBT 7711]|uniref:Uncharacterized protein n=1 Tax=Stachybotrys chartarum (strain CBS 109288 / IBT 7711) TaxID=1280523 RepID=A0A084B5P9_STACB|nr:hypothetical protein S7711_09975 [Stachybotrys chartarum IBT 7711]KFA53375.1 hypothetical protein S40293_09398 [Stachybotrys chartarum IBT 40293]KFA80370.1 hypothetical protein S40288_10113 [Stachybotrys chartarum IBT 40288]
MASPSQVPDLPHDTQQKPNSMSLSAEAQPKVLDERGAVGKQFTEHGTVGGTAQKLGGAFDKRGVIGKLFTTEGSIGGTIQSNMGGSTTEK